MSANQDDLMIEPLVKSISPEPVKICRLSAEMFLVFIVNWPELLIDPSRRNFSLTLDGIVRLVIDSSDAIIISLSFAPTAVIASSREEKALESVQIPLGLVTIISEKYSAEHEMVDSV